jgi:hypothetical protein
MTPRAVDPEAEHVFARLNESFEEVFAAEHPGADPADAGLWSAFFAGRRAYLERIFAAVLELDAGEAATVIAREERGA